MQAATDVGFAALCSSSLPLFILSNQQLLCPVRLRTALLLTEEQQFELHIACHLDAHRQATDLIC